MDNREKGYTIDELLAEMEPQYRVYRNTIRDCISGLTGHAARLAAEGEEGQLPTLRRMIGDMSDFWGLAEDTTPKACQETREQYESAFDQAVSAARDSGSAPELSEQARADILAGLELHAPEMSATGDMEKWIDECDSLAAQLRTEWGMETPQTGGMRFE